ncbi:hypothetical protein J8J40_34530, partial [Mycobacterium tuberculosis]|nr:hypothetical protein [Mycobacterium tuberculosis]
MIPEATMRGMCSRHRSAVLALLVALAAAPAAAQVAPSQGMVASVKVDGAEKPKPAKAKAKKADAIVT